MFGFFRNFEDEVEIMKISINLGRIQYRYALLEKKLHDLEEKHTSLLRHLGLEIREKEVVLAHFEVRKVNSNPYLI